MEGESSGSSPRWIIWIRPMPNGWGHEHDNHQNSSGISANLHRCSGRLDGACDVVHRRNCEGVLVKKERWSWL
jgi:hypothetical protein